ncbi:hypothetical protein J6590_016110 [Homalodisca vitripennis]|nr:hypothetical protein J6590_016110 [Homalodisca vitripennis]
MEGRRIQWMGHVKRMGDNRMPRIALEKEEEDQEEDREEDGRTNSEIMTFCEKKVPLIKWRPPILSTLRLLRKAESRVFAGRSGITVEALTQFVLSNLPLELRLVTMLQLCQRYSDNQFNTLAAALTRFGRHNDGSNRTVPTISGRQ